MTEFAKQRKGSNDAFFEQRLDALYEGFRKGIDREVERRRKAGLPIYVSDNGRVVDLQKYKPGNQSAPSHS